MKPLTKLSRQIASATMIPTLVREAFRIASEERPGPVHLELPEDIAGEECDDPPLIPPHPVELPMASPEALDRATAMIIQAKKPLVMLGAAASRPRSTSDLALFVDGSWRVGEGRAAHDVVNPATGGTLAEVPLANAADLA